MKVLVACECSGVVRDAFASVGHDAWSCDLKPTERPGQHIQGDVLEILNDGWDLMIAHPPCTFLCNSGCKHLYRGMKKPGGPDHQRWIDMAEGAHFFWQLLQAPIERICIENPIMHGYGLTYIGEEPEQIIQPWQFWHLNEPGTGETKATCLWLKNLPPLMPTTPLEAGRRQAVWSMGPSPTRGEDRSRTYPGIADAMAGQWGAARYPRSVQRGLFEEVTV